MLSVTGAALQRLSLLQHLARPVQTCFLETVALTRLDIPAVGHCSPQAGTPYMVNGPPLTGNLMQVTDDHPAD